MRSIITKPQIVSGPPITPTLAWYDPSDLASLTVAGGLCSQMNDKSGNARHLTAAGTARPTSGAATINGRNVLTFGNPTIMVSANFTQAQPITAFQVVKRVGASAGLDESLGNANITPALFTYTAGVWAYFAGTVVASAVTADLNAHVLDATFTGASSSLRLDGAAIAAGNPAANGYATAPIQFGNQTGAANGWNGVIGETLMYASALSAPNIAAAEAYLKAKWGTP